MQEVEEDSIKAEEEGGVVEEEEEVVLTVAEIRRILGSTQVGEQEFRRDGTRATTIRSLWDTSRTIEEEEDIIKVKTKMAETAAVTVKAVEVVIKTQGVGIRILEEEEEATKILVVDIKTQEVPIINMMTGVDTNRTTISREEGEGGIKTPGVVVEVGDEEGAVGTEPYDKINDGIFILTCNIYICTYMVNDLSDFSTV
uniref:Uncharacterized protein n=1 Tax=Cacopsylla melanoneura TaxID=428564 RepID=A0A8D8WZT4_9HEMI